MKKQLYLILFFALLSTACSTVSEQKAVLKGKIGNAPSDLASITYWTLEDNKWREVSDTCRIVDGQFSFDLHINALTKARLFFDANSSEAIIYLEPKPMEIFFSPGSIVDYTLTGTDSDKEFEPLRKQIAKPADSLNILVYDKIRPLIHKFEQSNSEEYLLAFQTYRDNLAPIMDYFNNKINTANLEYIKKHPNSEIAAGQLLDVIKLSKWEIFPMDSTKLLYESLSGEVKKSQLGQLALKQIHDIESEAEIKSALEIGKTAPAFSAYSLVSKDTVRLSDYKGKSYVLLDFWSSGCRPCIQEIPFLREIHKKYQNKGFTIIGISSDYEKDRYIDAIEKHNLKDWPQILNVQNPEELQKEYVNKEDIKEKYNILAEPTYLLIDPNGTIVGRWEGKSDDNEKEMIKMLEAIYP